MFLRKYKIFLIPVTIILFSGFFKGDDDIYLQVSKSIEIFGKIYKEVTFNYTDKINPEEFMISGINGMLSSLDPYTVFIDEKRKDDIDLLTNGKYGGIGVSIGLRNDKVTIVDLIEGYTAQRQGLRIGDVLYSVNGTEITKDNFDDISSFVKGEPGTEVKIIILRDGGSEKLVFNLIREEVKIKNLTFSDFVPENSNTVYLKLISFTRTAGDEIKKALIDLNEQKEIKSIVLDIRGNPGGLLDAAIDVCEKFLKKSQLVISVMGRDSSSYKKYYSNEEPIASNNKLIVLVDNGSASASEIVAGAIQDHDRGLILGTETFGKGLVQTVVPLSYNTSLKITTARYYTPSGRCIQKIDYSKSNKVVKNSQSSTNKDFATDNKRTVFASGGIKPDTIVKSEDESAILKELSSKGIIFKFATDYFSQTNKNNFINDSNDNLYRLFADFIKKEKFEYSTSAEKQITELINTSEKEKYSIKILDELINLKNKLKGIRDQEMENHKNEIVVALKNELYTRFEGLAGRIRNSLSYDKQFQVALSILKDDKLYSHLLTHN
ncbi:MAG: S41 family peptidase [Ignavibacteriales bacterium]|nr:S41 family peptidase [Ignavibacteriales bacterium]